MEMLKKSGIALVLGSLMLASIPTTTQCLSLPQINLNKLSFKQLVIAAVLVYAPFFLLHNPDIVPDVIKDSSLYQMIIGSEEKDEKYDIVGLDSDSFKFKKREKVPSTGLIGKLDSAFLKPWDKTVKNVDALLKIAGFLAIIVPLGAKVTETVVSPDAHIK